MADHNLDIYINADGSIQTIYSDLAQELFAGDAVDIHRASHVEPCGSGWVADLSPVDGPMLTDNGLPFKTRGEALVAEMDWLRDALDHSFLIPVSTRIPERTDS